MFAAWETDLLDRLNVSDEGAMDIRLALHEVLHELRYPAAQRQAEHVVQYQYLAIGGAAGANACLLYTSDAADE